MIGFTWQVTWLLCRLCLSGRRIFRRTVIDARHECILTVVADPVSVWHDALMAEWPRAKDTRPAATIAAPHVADRVEAVLGASAGRGERAASATDGVVDVASSLLVTIFFCSLLGFLRAPPLLLLESSLPPRGHRRHGAVIG